jgi:hypothetical protein
MTSLCCHVKDDHKMAEAVIELIAFENYEQVNNLFNLILSVGTTICDIIRNTL